MAREITVIEARNLLQNASEKKLDPIDIRSPEEVAKASVPGFRNVPLEKLSLEIPTYDLSKKVLLLCHRGKTSLRAQELLESCGINSLVIRGGIDDWAQIIDPSLARY